MPKYTAKIRSTPEPIQVRSGDNVAFEGWASTDGTDRYDERIIASGWKLDNYKRNPILLKDHDTRSPIGTLPHVEIREHGLYVRGQLGRGWPAADAARAQVAQGVVRCLSVGFREVAKGRVAPDGCYEITGAELIEVSLVSAPANVDCVIEIADDGSLRSIDLLPDLSGISADRVAHRIAVATAQEEATDAAMASLKYRMALLAARIEADALLDAADERSARLDSTLAAMQRRLDGMKRRVGVQ
jgi:HK97 family phage prohead protease